MQIHYDIKIKAQKYFMNLFEREYMMNNWNQIDLKFISQNYFENQIKRYTEYLDKNVGKRYIDWNWVYVYHPIDSGGKSSRILIKDKQKYFLFLLACFSE